MNRRYFVGGNWETAGNKVDVESFCELADHLEVKKSQGDVVIAPPIVLAGMLADQLKHTNVTVGSQDALVYGSNLDNGAIRADYAEILEGIGVSWAIIGHSKQRKIFEKSDFDYGVKVKNALDNGMNVILCVGESKTERLAGKTDKVITSMLKAVVNHLTPEEWYRVVLCYEPVWIHGVEGH